MHFAARYTRYRIAPYAHQRGAAPPGYHLHLTVVLRLEHDATGRMGTAGLSPLIVRALNEHAGGNRVFQGTHVSVEWSVEWSSVRVESGRVLGVAILPDDVVDVLGRPNHGAGAVTLVSLGGSRDFGRMIYRASLFDRLQAPRRPETQSERIRRRARSERARSTIAHEVGHAAGLEDRRSGTGSTMYYAQLTDQQYQSLDQRWSDAELRTALQNIFSGPDRPRPAWL
jgi:hypothetical protein